MYDDQRLMTSFSGKPYTILLKPGPDHDNIQKVITLAKPTREFWLTRSLGVQINTLHTGRSNWLRLGFLFVFLLINLPFSSSSYQPDY